MPKRLISEAVEKGRAKMRKEDEFRKEAGEGKLLLRLMNLDEVLKKAGVEEIKE